MTDQHDSAVSQLLEGMGDGIKFALAVGIAFAFVVAFVVLLTEVMPLAP